MISKLAKSIAHFFVTQKIVEEPKEVIYAYGLELMLNESDALTPKTIKLKFNVNTSTIERME